MFPTVSLVKVWKSHIPMKSDLSGKVSLFYLVVSGLLDSICGLPLIDGWKAVFREKKITTIPVLTFSSFGLSSRVLC